MLLAGISPDAMVWLAPFTTFHSAFVHANLRWTLGPLKYVIATPVFHRWHHTGLDEGGKLTRLAMRAPKMVERNGAGFVAQAPKVDSAICVSGL